MRLKSIVPPLAETLLAALDDCNIRTDSDLLFSGTPLQIYEKLPQGTISLGDLERHIRNLIEYLAAPAIRANELLVQEKVRHDASGYGTISCGVSELDKLTDGYSGPKVLEISGDHGSGKSLLALQIVIRQLASTANYSALWIDTTGDFSVDKIYHVMKGLEHMPAVTSTPERLQVALAFDVNTVQDTLDLIRRSHDEPDGPIAVRYLVIDTITALFRPLLSVVSSQGHAMMTSFMQQLRSFATTYPLSILIINSTSSAGPRNSAAIPTAATRKPALGPSFAYMTDATLWLAKSEAQVSEEGDNIGPVYTAEVLRSRFTPSKTTATFQVRDGMICGQ